MIFVVSLGNKWKRFGYSILSPMKQQKSTFNSYNLFPAVNLIQNMANVLFAFSTILISAQEYMYFRKMDKNVVSGAADQVAAVILTVSVYKLQTKVFI